MKSTTLVIMAAGMGSRFGGGIKQLEPMGPNGEIIMDYSIYDAMEAGFNKVVFVTRKDLFETFKEVIGNRIEKVIPVEYVFQELDDLPEGFEAPADRTKPWGTGQAILACKGVVNEPFLVINADDYYGKTAFKLIHDYLVSDKADSGKYEFCMAGFILGNTLSDNGAVTRGVCVMDKEGHLTGVNETGGIVKTADGAAAEDKDGNVVVINPASHVSMNMWGFTPQVFGEMKKAFDKFIDENGMDMKAHYSIPAFMNERIADGVRVKVIETPARWMGLVSHDDKIQVLLRINDMKGIYPSKLF